MQQQINLYRHLKQAPTFFLTLNVVLIIYAVFTFFLFIDTAFDIYKKNELETTAQMLSITMDKEKKLLDQVKLQYPAVNLSDLEGSMQRLKQDLNAKAEIAAILSHQTLFSNYLTALSNSVVQGVWLTEINITKSGQNITLTGLAVKATLVHAFSERLRKQSLFANMKFSLQEIAQTPGNDKGHSYVNFSITGEVDNQR